MLSWRLKYKGTIFEKRSLEVTKVYMAWSWIRLEAEGEVQRAAMEVSQAQLDLRLRSKEDEVSFIPSHIYGLLLSTWFLYFRFQQWPYSCQRLNKRLLS